MLLFELLYILLCLPFAFAFGVIYHPPVAHKAIVKYGPIVIKVSLAIYGLELLALLLGFGLDWQLMRGLAGIFMIPAIILYGLLPIESIVVGRNYKKHENSVTPLLVFANSAYWLGLILLFTYFTYIFVHYSNFTQGLPTN